MCNIVTQSMYYPLSFAVAVAAADSYAVEKLKVLEDKYPYIKKPTEDVSTCTWDVPWETITPHGLHPHSHTLSLLN